MGSSLLCNGFEQFDGRHGMVALSGVPVATATRSIIATTVRAREKPTGAIQE
jgi:hypothetical protein